MFLLVFSGFVLFCMYIKRNTDIYCRIKANTKSLHFYRSEQNQDKFNKQVKLIVLVNQHKSSPYMDYGTVNRRSKFNDIFKCTFLSEKM